MSLWVYIDSNPNPVLAEPLQAGSQPLAFQLCLELLSFLALPFELLLELLDPGFRVWGLGFRV